MLYSSRVPGYSLFLTASGATFAPADAAPVEMTLVGARAEARTVAEALLPGRSHYLRGTDAAQWKRDVAHYGRVRYDEVWPGVDLVYYGAQGELEYDFVVAPGADPSVIRLRSAGAKLDASGDIALSADVRVRKPIAYQTVAGVRQPVRAEYRLEGGDVVVALGDYDRAQTLVIDPVVVYSTYLGSKSWDEAYSVAVDADGNAYLAGLARANNFPVQNALDPTYNGGDYDAFVTKLSADGQTLLYSTYLGGTSYDYAQAVAIDATGAAYVTGSTGSTDFPTAGVVRPYAGLSDVFVVKLSPDGAALLWGTYLGGAVASEGGRSIALDPSGNAYVAGTTSSSDFPAFKGFQMTFGGIFDTFVAKFAGGTGALVYATFLGGSAQDWQGGLAVDALGRAYVIGYTASTDFPTAAALQTTRNGGTDVYVTRLAATGKTLSYSTYLGGSDTDRGFAIAVDASSAAYITGDTASTDFPTVNTLQPPHAIGGGLPQPDAFVAKLAYDGSALRFSTFLGGTKSDAGNGIALDADRNIYVAGTTWSEDFPLLNAFQTTPSGYYGAINAFVTKIKVGGTAIAFSSALGGAGYDFADAIAVDPQNQIYVAGRSSGGFPTVNPLQPAFMGKDDAFVARISQDADAARDVIEFAKDVYYTDESKTFASIGLTRSGSGYGDVLARVTTAPGTASAGYDYDSTPTSVSWRNAQMNLRGAPIRIIGDATHNEPAETVHLALEVTDGFAVVGPRQTAQLRIRNFESGAPQNVGLAVSVGTAPTSVGSNWSVPVNIVVRNQLQSAMPNVTVNLVVAGEAFQKGTSEFGFWDDGQPSHWGPLYVASAGGNGFGCASEDANGNAALDAGEDLNSNGTLQPGIVATAGASAVTNSEGIASFTMVYPKTHAMWVRAALLATAGGDYTGSAPTRLFILPASTASLSNPSQPPPNQNSPYGQTPSCADPG